MCADKFPNFVQIYNAFMKEIYVYGSCSVSIQPSFRDDYFFEEIKEYSENGISVIDPDYKEFIPALQLRRMGKSMRMSVYAAQKAIHRADNLRIDAVITGTGQGCLRDSEKFVEALWENEGGMLNPTPFIQSTHNMAAATIALSLGCKGYNMTYTNNSNSFESAALDAMVLLNETPEKNVVLGGLDEISQQTLKFWQKAGFASQKGFRIPFPHNANNTGETVSEGAGFFVVSGEKRANPLGKIKNVKTLFEAENPTEMIKEFLAENKLQPEDLDAVILGINGDGRFDGIYHQSAQTLFDGIPQIIFKNVLGEFDTVQALAVDIALKVFQKQQIPDILQLNNQQKDSYHRILIYNQRRGKNHGLILLER